MQCLYRTALRTSSTNSTKSAGRSHSKPVLIFMVENILWSARGDTRTFAELLLGSHIAKIGTRGFCLWRHVRSLAPGRSGHVVARVGRVRHGHGRVGIAGPEPGRIFPQSHAPVPPKDSSQLVALGSRLNCKGGYVYIYIYIYMFRFP